MQLRKLSEVTRLNTAMTPKLPSRILVNERTLFINFNFNFHLLDCGGLHTEYNDNCCASVATAFACSLTKNRIWWKLLGETKQPSVAVTDSIHHTIPFDANQRCASAQPVSVTYCAIFKNLFYFHFKPTLDAHFFGRNKRWAFVHFNA